MNNLVYIFSDLLYASLPLLAPVLWFRFWFAFEHLCGECLTHLLRWLLLSAAGSAGGGVRPVYYGCAWIPLRERVGQLANSFLFVLLFGISDFRVVAIDRGMAVIGPPVTRGEVCHDHQYARAAGRPQAGDCDRYGH